MLACIIPACATWEVWNSRRPCKAPLDSSDIYSVRCLINIRRGKPTISSETQDLLLGLQNSDIWTNLVTHNWHNLKLCETIEEIPHAFCKQFCTQKMHSKRTLQRWKWWSESENPLRRHSLKNNGWDPTGKSPRDSNISPMPTMRVTAFLTTLYRT